MPHIPERDAAPRHPEHRSGHPVAEPHTPPPGTPSRPARPDPSYAEVVAELRAAGCVFAEEEARLLVAAARDGSDLAGKVALRVSGVPLEHVVGWAEFGGHRIAVDAGVFVPRRRTEFLAERALAHGRALIGGARRAAAADGGARRPVVVDLCCGSGALGVVLAAGLPGARVHACDLDPAAVACARRNLAPFGGTVHHGDLFAPLPAHLRGRVDVLAANLPYVPSGEVGLLPAEAREHEALIALDGGADGLDVLRRVAADAAGWLAPGGALLFETSERQAAPALAIVRAGGLRARSAYCEERYATVVTAVRPA